MDIRQAAVADAPQVAAVLQEAAQWLADGGRALWVASAVSDERVLRDVAAGLFFAARDKGGEIVGVARFDLEDPYFWPEIDSGSSAFIHKLAVRRQWAGQGVSAALLAFAKARAESMGLPYLRLDCVADRTALRTLYEGFGFTLHSCIQKGSVAFARYELRTGA
ncbi:MULTISPECIES: GNAT family N-acetyltransferase [unclassified Variovorax]|uniref:GNAT family N-acetyltransferase n=1 Tax=Variovorax sp. dw_954 TaxID=2720078 RepID=UPI00210B9E0F|nr:MULTISPECIES: GNAT family N-acetyltransferase [unclassified Variovorax]